MNVIDKQETCIGCGTKALTLPMVAIIAVEIEGAEEVTFKSEPVCRACHEDPSSRVTPIKGHFFDRRDAEVALRRAGSSELG